MTYGIEENGEHYLRLTAKEAHTLENGGVLTHVLMNRHKTVRIKLISVVRCYESSKINDEGNRDNEIQRENEGRT